LANLPLRRRFARKQSRLARPWANHVRRGRSGFHSRASFGGSRDVHSRSNGRESPPRSPWRIAAAPGARAADIKVDVTGTNIKRIDGETGQPLQVITKEEIASSGATTAMELLDRIAINSPVGNYTARQRVRRQRAHRLLGRVAARPRLQVHGRPAQRPPHRELRARRHGGRPERDPARLRSSASRC
jgi:hypothetical protein